MKTKVEVAALFYTVLEALHNAKANQGNPLRGIPNGHLYAQLMGFVSFEYWQRFVASMKENGQVTESGYLLTITDKGEELYQKLHEVLEDMEKNKTCPPPATV